MKSATFVFPVHCKRLKLVRRARIFRSSNQDPLVVADKSATPGLSRLAMGNDRQAATLPGQRQ